MAHRRAPLGTSFGGSERATYGIHHIDGCCCAVLLAWGDPSSWLQTTQVCVIGPGHIVGDMTVLANVRKRTASVLAMADTVAYRIRRATFIRRLPPVQLEVRAATATSQPRDMARNVPAENTARAISLARHMSRHMRAPACHVSHA